MRNLLWGFLAFSAGNVAHGAALHADAAERVSGHALDLAHSGRSGRQGLRTARASVVREAQSAHHEHLAAEAGSPGRKWSASSTLLSALATEALADQTRMVLLQRSSARARHVYFHSRDQDTLWGLPKVVWVIIADVVAMLAVFALIPLVLSCAKRRSKRL